MTVEAAVLLALVRRRPLPIAHGSNLDHLSELGDFSVDEYVEALGDLLLIVQLEDT